MSHEGIRMISREESERAAQADQPLPAAAITPAKVKIELTEGTGVSILWKDGHRSHWTFPYLRDACPCATCHEEREKTGRALGEPRPAPKAVFPIYNPPRKAAQRRTHRPLRHQVQVGRWHESGIYSWDFLRRLDEGALPVAVAQ